MKIKFTAALLVGAMLSVAGGCAVLTADNYLPPDPAADEVAWVQFVIHNENWEYNLQNAWYISEMFVDELTVYGYLESSLMDDKRCSYLGRLRQEPFRVICSYPVVPGRHKIFTKLVSHAYEYYTEFSPIKINIATEDLAIGEKYVVEIYPKTFGRGDVEQYKLAAGEKDPTADRLNFVPGKKRIPKKVEKVLPSEESADQPVEKNAAPPARKKSIEERMLELQGLKDKGLINDAEYKQKKQELLDEL